LNAVTAMNQSKKEYVQRDSQSQTREQGACLWAPSTHKDG